MGSGKRNYNSMRQNYRKKNNKSRVEVKSEDEPKKVNKEDVAKLLALLKEGKEDKNE